jgi:citrate lyase subunit beta / citryl-CoA lyase
MSLAQSYLALAQTFLFSPGHRPEFFPKALNSLSKAMIIDLEDAVAPEQKPFAREQVGEFLKTCSAEERQKILIRINPIDSIFNADDVRFLHDLNLLLHLVVPKVESIDQLQQLASQLDNLAGMIPIIESAQGLDHVKMIAKHPLVIRLALGNIDAQADLGLSCDAQESELLPMRFAITLASRLANIAPPIDGVTTDINNEATLINDTQRAKRLGFGGKLCIHPKQVQTIMQCFTPSADEIEYAKRVIAADSAAQGAAVQLDGKMIDRPVVMLAQRTLKLANIS